MRPRLLICAPLLVGCHLVLPLSAPGPDGKDRGIPARLDLRLDRPALPDSDAEPSQNDGTKDGWATSWITISHGTFKMGSPTSEPCRPVNDNEVLHEVTLTHGFEIQATEVTQGQFKQIMAYNPSYFGPNGPPGLDCGADCPVDRVTWHEAAAYCNMLSKEKGWDACYTCNGRGKDVDCTSNFPQEQIYSCPSYRLPTEAEWEYAYRAGTQTPYYNGDNNPGTCSGCSAQDTNATAIAYYCANTQQDTQPVGQLVFDPERTCPVSARNGGRWQDARAKSYLWYFKPEQRSQRSSGPARLGTEFRDRALVPNAWGLRDMAGNVEEWCHDRYEENLGNAAVTDPWGPSMGNERVLRGGSCSSNSSYLRGAARRGMSPTTSPYRPGFRCVRSISP